MGGNLNCQLTLFMVSSHYHQHNYVNNFVQQSRKLMEQAYHRVCEHLSAGHQRQKDIYDKHIHGKPYQSDTSLAIGSCCSRGSAKEISPPL